MQLARYAAQNPEQAQMVATQLLNGAIKAGGAIHNAVRSYKADQRQKKRNANNKKQRNMPMLQDWSAPVAINRPIARRQPKFLGNVEGTVTIQHSELITTLIGSIPFASQVLSVQPGLSGCFPWLSSIAANFEKYQLVSLSFRYKPSAATSTAGSLLLAYSRDPYVQPNDVGSVSEMSQFPQFIDSSAFAPYTMGVDKTMLQQELFIRHGNVASTDLKTYDHGALIIGTDGFATTAQIGRVYVDYTVRLKVPKPQECPGTDIIVSGGTSAQLFGSAGSTRLFAGTDIFLSNTAGSFTLQFNGPGFWYITILVLSAARGTLTVATGTPNISFTSFTTLQDATALSSEFKLYVSSAASTTKLTFTTGTAFGVVTSARLIITPEPSDINIVPFS